MAFTVVHSADWQLGMKAHHVGAAAEAVRAARLLAAARVIEIANRVQANALILAGDTFEDSNVPKELIQRTVDLLRTCKAPVLILPANHDPLVARGVFDHPAWRDAAANVTVIRSAEPISIGDADFFGAPLTTKRSHVDPLEVLPGYQGPRVRIRIGIAHGSLRNAGVTDQDIVDDFPMDLRHVTRASLDYLALGHWHIPSSHQVDGVVRAAYPGSHEPTKFGEASGDGKRVSGQCLVVRIEGPGAAPVLEVHRTAVLDWRQRSVPLSTRADLLALRTSLDGEPATSAQTGLLDLTLTGSIPAAEEAELGSLETLAAARFLYARVRTKGLLLQPGDNTWLNGLPDGAPQAAALKLLTQAQGQGRDAEVARLALLRLFELSQEFRA